MLIPKLEIIPNATVQISGSKSESNRLLILQKIVKNIQLHNLSNSKDTEILKKALNSNDETIDIHHAGTAMRFLTSYFAIMDGKTTILTGSNRMKQRPIQHLVNALRQLGTDISYMEKEGFPPIKIIGKKITKNLVKIPADTSSQFITSLLLIAPALENGLSIQLLGKITSRPYLEMTLSHISTIIKEDIKIDKEQTICIKSNITKPAKSEYLYFNIESDWSSASYFYSIAAIGRKSIYLKCFKKNSLQGDSAIAKLYNRFFGIKTEFINNETIKLSAIDNFTFPENICLDMNAFPDIAQTICVTASALRIHFKISGLSTLKIKETDRLVALKNELYKIGVSTEITEDSIESLSFHCPKKPISIATYDDHRMAMSFAPYALLDPLEIQNSDVVEKSYPDFWRDFYSIFHFNKS